MTSLSSMSEDDNYTYQGKQYEIETVQEFEGGSLLMTLKPVPSGEDEDIVNA